MNAFLVVYLNFHFNWASHDSPMRRSHTHRMCWVLSAGGLMRESGRRESITYEKEVEQESRDTGDG